MTTLRITNATRNSILATHATVATSPDARRIGLIGTSQREFVPGVGLFMTECNAIHTVQMAFPIDVLFIDMMHKQVIKIGKYVQPGCHFNTLIPADLSAVLEVPAGTIEATGTQPGDKIELLSSAHATQEDLNRIGAGRW